MPRVTLLRASTSPTPPFADPTSNSGARSAVRRDEIQSCDPLLRPSTASPSPSTGSPPGEPIEQFPEITFRSMAERR
ncbi:hypothetical protein C2845_PM01G36870 [Panicum miliaceum]|uniref:Uncharacterized protein n=1 Tax=Panicum miliaceum TaxID=4540 RepID=A0A3L6TIJ7_PANMI|nr:hypothetical protein C2845_PM01G36870 [Panicum miliaceum]